MSTEDNITNSPTRQLKNHANMQIKQHIILDSPGSKRPKFIFVAPIDAIDGAPCTCTEYVYVEINSTIVVKRQEREYRWKTAWEGGTIPFTFDPTADYDPDGDGYL